MPDLDANNEVAAVRRALMEDLASPAVVASALAKSPRTIARLIAAGKIPTIMVGRTPYVILSKAREALMSGAPVHHAPVKRGRPAKKTA